MKFINSHQAMTLRQEASLAVLSATLTPSDYVGIDMPDILPGFQLFQVMK